ncbi:hypothetical protein MICA_1177 [Micavibrio aeruginosavorus ARL-13]|uniref:Uncharacterized protein n=1 Tax=Micavibrio aeruginosavorus (strain ARL-13) TaxID=856793 RepID=G2KPK0_MICAA|nr:hypothetical protein MICA_1177 [Micavibrio aeruginosavorus ARL-13]
MRILILGVSDREQKENPDHRKRPKMPDSRAFRKALSE